MSNRIAFRLNEASEAQIAEHLLRCDSSFVPPLSSRVEIAGYAQKIARKAMRFEAWERTLVGLLATYCNDAERRLAYISSVSTLAEWRGKGVASRLLEQCITYARCGGFEIVELEVDCENMGSRRLYEKQGFVVDSVDGRKVIMRLDLAKEA